MSRNNGLKLATLAASIALAMGNTAAMAATTAPAAGQLPGKGTIVAGGTGVVAGTVTNGAQTISLGSADGNNINAVINWGAGADINATGTGGFDIGSGASLTFANATSNGTTTGTASVLNIDSSGNPSQIFGALVANNTNVFVANSNGVIVGAGATVNGNISLIANKLAAGADAAFAADPSTFAYNGAGGDVTVQKGASLSGTILISGGGNVNVDLSAINGASVSLNAGMASSNAGSFATNNIAATLNVTGANTSEGNVTGFNSAGSASNAGVLNISGLGTDVYSVGGLFTNTGMLYLPAVNGAVHNQGELTTPYLGGTFNGGLINDGTFTANNGVRVVGGDFVNNGTTSQTGTVDVYDGSIVNKGTMNDVDGLNTHSDANYAAGADYSVTNAGTVSESINHVLNVRANEGTAYRFNDPGNTTTGSFTNTGKLNIVDTGTRLSIFANDNIAMGGTIEVAGAPISSSHPLVKADIEALDILGNASGKLTLTTPLVATNEVYLVGKQEVIMADVTGVGTGYVEFDGGDKLANDYAIRIGAGVTVSSDNKIYVDGYNETDHPNVILQGTLSSNTVYLGYNSGLDYAVSDFFSGPNGKIVLTDDSSNDQPQLVVDFTGKVKAAPYLNDANFRFNYLPVTVDSAQTAYVEINPDGYQASGSPDAGVNLLFNGSVTIDNTAVFASVTNGDSAVTGVNVIPNTHLVLQATGNISTYDDFYWPGYVYLGNIATNADGSAAPGTLGYGTIALGGDFNNVLPGDTSGAGGIHFITQYPLVMNGRSVTTNANSWINFGTDALTAAYAAGVQGGGMFFGGVQGSGNVVNYGDLDPSLFHTQAPVSSK